MREHAALYLGGMGTREQNFYNALARRMGFGRRPIGCSSCTWSGSTRTPPRPYRSSSSTRPSLLGPAERIAERMRMHSDAGVTTLAVRPYGASVAERIAALHTAVDAVHRAGVAA